MKKRKTTAERNVCYTPQKHSRRVPFHTESPSAPPLSLCVCVCVYQVFPFFFSILLEMLSNSGRGSYAVKAKTSRLLTPHAHHTTRPKAAEGGKEKSALSCAEETYTVRECEVKGARRPVKRIKETNKQKRAGKRRGEVAMARYNLYQRQRRR